MTDKQPEALRLAEFIENDIPPFSEWVLVAVASKLRTQHAALERKDALLRQVLAAYEQDEGLAMGRVVDAITKELQ